MLRDLAIAAIGGGVGALVTLGAVVAAIWYGWRPVLGWIVNLQK